MKRLLSVVLFIMWCVMVSAKVYYVAPTGGSDTFPGTISQPWATWQKAFNTARAGDTVYFRGGVYYRRPGETTDIIPRDGLGYSGTADNYIHYFNYPGEKPILDCSLIRPDVPKTGQNGYNTGLYIDEAKYLHFRGLTIRNVFQVYERVFSQGLVAVSCNFHIYENMTIHNISGRGVYYSPNPAPDSTYFINCDIYNCVDSLDTNGFAGGWGDGINGGNEDNSYLSFSGCRIWDCSDDGFNLWGQGLLEVRNCWAFNNGKLDGDGCGFKMNVPWDETDTDLHRIFTNNIAAYNAGNTGAGFTENNNGMLTVYSNMYNNTSYRNMTGFTTIGNNVGPQFNNIYRNNIAYANLQYDDEESQDGVFNTNDHNSWNAELGVKLTDADFISLDVSQLSRPRKSDGSLPDITFLKLASGSDLIDVGINVGLSFSGTAPDLGYSEYLSGTVTPPAPVYVSSAIQNASPSRLEMTYNLTLANVIPATSAFTVRVNSTTRAVSSVAISGTKVLLTLASPVVFGDVVTVAYTKPSTNPLQTSAGGVAASITARNVTNNVTAAIPVYVSSVIENATPTRLEMAYNLTLANVIPATSAFTVRVNSTTRAVSSVAISGTKVLLTLASPVVFGDVVTVAYTKPSTNPLQTSQGGQAASLTAQTVINNCSLVANLPPVVTITSPTKSITFIAPADITIEASASDPDGSISKVEFFNGSTKLGERTATPYSFTWKGVAEGTYLLTAVASDNLNSKTVSAAVTVIVEKSSTSVNQLPVVSVKTPGDRKKFKKNEKITITAEASDPDGTVSKVEFYNGTLKMAEVMTSPYSYTLEGMEEGTYEISAIATDNLGATNKSAIIAITIDALLDISSENIKIYPNPNDGNFTMELLTSPAFDNTNITITNISGERIYRGVLATDQTLEEFNLSGSAPGTYILMITSGNTVFAAKKFIKK